MNPDEHHVALPKLYGAPAYARPPRVFEVNERPPDPDDLPLEVFREAEGAGLAVPAAAPPASEPSEVATPDDATPQDAVPSTDPSSRPSSGLAMPGDVPSLVDGAEAGESGTSPDGAGIDPAGDDLGAGSDAAEPAPAGPFNVRALGRFIQRR